MLNTLKATTLLDMIKEDLVAERIAIDSYREMIQYFGNDDPTSRRMLEGILAMEEEHADDLVSLLETVGTLASSSVCVLVRPTRLTSRKNRKHCWQFCRRCFRLSC